MLIGAHCHLANLSRLMPLSQIMDEAQKQGIGLYLSSALNREEVRIYQCLNDPRIRYSAGIHPHWEDCDLELEDLRQLCAAQQIWALGEIGVDRSGPPIVKQLDIFEAQLQLAKEYGLPVVLHIVGQQQAAWELIKHYHLRYLVHGYAGSIQGYQLLAQANSWFTISERILRADKAKLLAEILDSKRYLLETDITSMYVQPREHNPLLRLLDVLERAEESSGIDRQELIATQQHNYLLLSGEING
ncbi:MAG: TatD family hydrolase [Candidatus Cloacimonetes bacterium]|nr:TatD family hydrolase [Candidatus Cloacimonadota bacterium]